MGTTINKPQISTLGELRAQGYQPKSIREELRDNLLLFLAKGENVFKGIYGYEHSVIQISKGPFCLGTTLICWVYADKQKRDWLVKWWIC